MEKKDGLEKEILANPLSIKVHEDIDPEKYADSAKEEDDLVAVKQQLKNEGGFTGYEINDRLANLNSIITDIVAGDKEAMERPEFQCLNFPAIAAAIKWLNETDVLSDSAKAGLFTDAWRLNFRCKPPTPQEFLSEKFIGPMSESLYDPVKKSFCEFFDPLAPYRTGVLGMHIGWGKSAWVVLSNLFLSTHFAMMWHPYKFFGQSVSTVYTQVLGAWNLKKASELLLEPFMNILENSPYFVKIRTHGEIIDKQNDEEIGDHIYWTSATKTSCLQMQNGVNYKIVNNPGAILGQTILSGSVSEITMWEENGWTQDQILTFFTKLRKRIDSRMKGNYYGRFLLDSQPNSMESVIDKWIWEDAPKDPKNYILTGSRWKYYPEDFPEAWDENHNIKRDFINGFPLYKGGNGNPAQVIESEGQLATFDQRDVMWCPVKQITNNGSVNFWDAARENPVEFLRDWCGIPSGSADRIFYNEKIVEDIFDNSLKNVYGGLNVPAELEPEHLIWNQVKGIFFNKIVDKYYFYYEPNIPRVASVDLAITGDCASISVSHVERSKDLVDDEGNPAKIYVTDFSIPVVPKNSIINLDAFKFFLIDLVKLGNMRIKHVSFDGFQSRSIMQSLQRYGFEVDLLSVDKVNEPYQSLIDYAFHRRWVCGKSIMMKNNLLSLEIATRKTGTKKIDHKHGENCYADEFCPMNGVYSEQSWQMSQVGYYAKDLADTACANIALLDTYENEYFPMKVWNANGPKERTKESVEQSKNRLLAEMGLV